MNLQTVFDRERSRYVRQLSSARAEAAAASSACVAELLLSIDSETIPDPYRYLRVDLMRTDGDGNPQPCEVRVGLDPAFKPMQFKLGGLALEVHPFTWNSVRVLFDSPFRDARLLDSWITDHLDIDGRRADPESGWRMAIHSFTQVAQAGAWWHATGDFGTAPAAKLVEFLELVASQGPSRIVIAGGNSTT